MNYLYLFLFILSLDIFAKEDSYSLFIKACESTKILSESWEDDFRDRLNDCIKNQTEASVEISNQLLKAKPILDMIRQARTKKEWNSPDPRKGDLNSAYPEIQYWRYLGELATASIQEKIRHNKYDEAMDIYIDFKTVGTLYSKNNIIIPYLLKYAIEKKILLNSDMSFLDKCSLSYFPVLKELIDKTTIEQFLMGEKHHCINTIKNMAFVDLADTQQALIKILIENEYDQKLIAKVEKGDLLSIKQWEKIAIKNYLQNYDYRMKLYQTTAPNKLRALGDKLEKEEKSAKQTDELIKTWQDKISKINKNDVTQLQELQKNVGEEISLILNSMLLPDLGGAIIKLKEYHSYERLVLIRMAQRVYFNKTQTAAKTLQDLIDQQILEKEMIIDPLSQKEFLLNEQNQAYGVGPDFDDDLGVPYDRHKKSGDII
ncbi:hypothetical protein PQO03_01045 [Lentisphaera profundi]|uniref:Uncharacterized protein n=1 Tax=Lentisphaera profundi TaxID=1658616 RepID=A0ABY7VUI2_9BACT|nr:hypothetical protein [Lentisphaera profundi]WDE96552.1 hypothetical protein PQO03_01045 [Lentisphaera profundi]